MARLIMYSLFALLLCTGCSKKNDPDNTPPVIMITTPVNNQVFTAGTSVQITGTVTDDHHIVEIHIHIYNQGTGVLLSDYHLGPGTSTASFSQPLSVAAGITYRIEILATDNSANSATASVTVTGN